MPNEFTRMYATAARFDHVKLTFPDVHPVHRKNVDEVISFALGKVSEKYGTAGLKLPKMTTLEPSPAKPNGKYIVELWGVASMLVMYLPAEWLEFATYVHVKAPMVQPAAAGIERIKAMCESSSGVLTYTWTQPSKRSNTKTKSPEGGIRLGSRKSGTHFSLYARPGQPVGLEARFRDEAVKNVAWTALGQRDKSGLGDMATWQLALFLWSQRGAEKFSHEWYARELDPHELGYPVTYEEMKEGANYEDLKGGHRLNAGHYYGD